MHHWTQSTWTSTSVNDFSFCQTGMHEKFEKSLWTQKLFILDILKACTYSDWSSVRILAAGGKRRAEARRWERSVRRGWSSSRALDVERVSCTLCQCTGTGSTRTIVRSALLASLHASTSISTVTSNIQGGPKKETRVIWNILYCCYFQQWLARYLSRIATFYTPPALDAAVNFCLCRHAVSFCPSVTFVTSVKTNKYVFNFCSPSGSQTILVFRYQTSWQYSDGVLPPNGTLNAGAVGNKNLAIANRSRVSCAQYVEGIYDNPVTLKSRLRITQAHWKRNHCVDHTRLTISRVIWRWILSWP